jgi:hypothetical protein
MWPTTAAPFFVYDQASASLASFATWTEELHSAEG